METFEGKEAELKFYEDKLKALKEEEQDVQKKITELMDSNYQALENNFIRLDDFNFMFIEKVIKLKDVSKPDIEVRALGYEYFGEKYNHDTVLCGIATKYNNSKDLKVAIPAEYPASYYGPINKFEAEAMLENLLARENFQFANRKVSHENKLIFWNKINEMYKFGPDKASTEDVKNDTGDIQLSN